MKDFAKAQRRPQRQGPVAPVTNPALSHAATSHLTPSGEPLHSHLWQQTLDVLSPRHAGVLHQRVGCATGDAEPERVFSRQAAHLTYGQTAEQAVARADGVERLDARRGDASGAARRRSGSGRSRY